MIITPRTYSRKRLPSLGCSAILKFRSCEKIGLVFCSPFHDESLSDAVLLLGEIYEQEGRKGDAKETYRKALSSGELPDQDSRRLRMKLQALEERKQKGKKE